MPAQTPSEPVAAPMVADERTLARLARLGEILCTPAETAFIMGVALETLDQFLDTEPSAKAAFDEGRGLGLEALRAAQLKLAATNATMAMFLGKNHLDQTNRREVEQSDPADVSDALQRLRAKLAAVAAAARAEGDREGR